MGGWAAIVQSFHRAIPQGERPTHFPLRIPNFALPTHCLVVSQSSLGGPIGRVSLGSAPLPASEKFDVAEEALPNGSNFSLP
jgi:hypothetical protein